MTGKSRERIRVWLVLTGVMVLVSIAMALGIMPAIAGEHHGNGSAPLSCSAQLKVIRQVSSQAGIFAGSVHTSQHSQGTPRTWARELRRAGLSLLARSAAGINDSVTDHDFVVAMTATADAYLTTGTSNCNRQPRPVVPGWFRWRMATYQVHDFGYTFPCVRVWGQDNQTPVNTGEFAWICEDGSVLPGDNP